MIQRVVSSGSKMPVGNRGTVEKLLLCAACFMFAVLAATSATPRPARAFDARTIEPSVYKIYSFMPEAGGQYSISSGTGFLISGQRHVVTNVHVVGGGHRIYIAFREGGEAKLVEAELTDRQPDVDLALLEAREDLPGTPLQVGKYEPEKLADVIAIGFPGAANLNKELVPESDARGVPLTDLEATVTTGVVSRMTFSHLKLTTDQTLSARTVQHNAAINPGSSGGPLLDACGQVVGVNTLQGVDAQGVFFSIHAGELVRFLRKKNLPYAAAAAGCSTSVLAGTVVPLVVSLSAILALSAFAMVRLGRGTMVLDAMAPLLARMPTLADAKKTLARLSPWMPGEGTKPPQNLCLRPVDGLPAMGLDPSGHARTIGRGPGADMTVRDDTVSKVHARLVYDCVAGKLRISDLSSSNGTYLNGKRLVPGEEEEAGRGARVSLGTMEFVVSEETPADEAARGWMLSGFDAEGRALQFELRPPVDSEGRVVAVTWALGRDPTKADFVVDDPSVSSTHAEIVFEPGKIMRVRDAGSMNGTHVDGETLTGEEKSLDRAGQDIAFGLARFRLSRLAK